MMQYPYENLLTDIMEFSLNGVELSMNSVNSGESEESLKHELGLV